MIRVLAILCIISIILCSAVVIEASDARSSSNNISNISVEEKDGLTEIRIEADSPFEYGVSTASSHYRIVVTLNGVGLGRFTDKISIGKSGVAEITTSETGDHQHSATFNISLTAPVDEVKPSLKGNTLILSVSTWDINKERKRNISQDVSGLSSEKNEEAGETASRSTNTEVPKPAFQEIKDNNATKIMVRTNFGGYISKDVVSLKQMKFKGIVAQHHDFSCGAASTATILKYVYGIEDVSEEKIVKEMIEKGDQELIKQKGFSLFDIKKYAERHDFQANGYKVEAENLSKLKIPTIILLNTRGYSHFAVLKGIKDGKAYLADPALGNRSIPLKEFIDSWNGVIMVIYKKTDKDFTFDLASTIRPPVENILMLNHFGVSSYTPMPGEF